MADINPTESSADETTECLESDNSSRVVSRLDRQKSPDPSLLGRKRKTLSNPPPIGKKRSTGIRGRNDPGVHPSKRVSEYPGELFWRKIV